MTFFPLFHNMTKQRVLIVGGGKVALRKAKALADAGAVIDVVAPTILPSLQDTVDSSGGQYSAREYTGELSQALGSLQYQYAIAATDVRSVNVVVATTAKALGISVNVCDDSKACDFVLGSTIERGPLTIGVSNSGASPILSRLLKQQLEMFIPDAYGELSEFVGQHREKVTKAIPEQATRVDFWQHILQGSVAEALFSGKPNEAEKLMDDALANPQAFNRKGEVYLIGAGPGDPDLLTIRAFRLLQQADLVVHDRLVSKEVMALIKPGTQLLYVGKQRSDHSVPQNEINQLLVDHAKQGKRVARLKGGDPFIFGRGGEEIDTLVEQNIPFQVVPGITAANGCSAYAGIPLTSRGIAQSVQFVTGQLKDGSIDLNWSELVAPDKTLVFYMGLSTLSVICQSLIDNGMDKTMPIALIEKGTTQSQRLFTSTLENMPQKVANESIESPSLIIVGKVVSLSDKLQWFG
ncbi:MAG: uroporphyrinogen-III C-methyltransferase [Algicola sp.]|nr:uroporphyrinogen-III C-methyltransferase [Algicola sp.]